MLIRLSLADSFVPPNIRILVTELETPTPPKDRCIPQATRAYRSGAR